MAKIINTGWQDDTPQTRSYAPLDTTVAVNSGTNTGGADTTGTGNVVLGSAGTAGLIYGAQKGVPYIRGKFAPAVVPPAPGVVPPPAAGIAPTPTAAASAAPAAAPGPTAAAPSQPPPRNPGTFGQKPPPGPAPPTGGVAGAARAASQATNVVSEVAPEAGLIARGAGAMRAFSPYLRGAGALGLVGTGAAELLDPDSDTSKGIAASNDEYHNATTFGGKAQALAGSEIKALGNIGGAVINGGIDGASALGHGIGGIVGDGINALGTSTGAYKWLAQHGVGQGKDPGAAAGADKAVATGKAAAATAQAQMHPAAHPGAFVSHTGEVISPLTHTALEAAQAMKASGMTLRELRILDGMAPPVRTATQQAEHIQLQRGIQLMQQADELDRRGQHQAAKQMREDGVATNSSLIKNWASPGGMAPNH
jgi:hypothetical protein